MKYEEFIKSIPFREKKTNDGLMKHHIIPKFANGNDKKNNLILLTFDEHFEAHELIFEKYKGTKLEYYAAIALGSFLRYQNHSKIPHSLTQEQYEKCINVMSSVEVPQEIRDKIGKAGKGRIKTIEEKERISKAHKGRKITWNDKISKTLKERFKDKTNHPFFGKKHTEETKNKLRGIRGPNEKMKKAAKERAKRLNICPHCGKEGRGPTMYRYHFSNCPVFTGHKCKGNRKD